MTKLKRRSAPKVARRRKPSTSDANEKIALLIRERDEALEQQKATAEVLRVISASPGELGPVFDVILWKAHSLCGAPFGGLMTYDGEFFRLAAQRNVPPAWAEWVRGPLRPGPKHPLSRFVRGEASLQIPDLRELAVREPDEPMPRAGVDLGGIRTILYVPLRKDGVLLGVITAYRQEVRLFTDQQIALLQTFADQAVIAIENTRLLNELRQRTDDLSESLEQQTATSDVLKVISNSPGELEPVFNAMLANATRICEATFGNLWLFEGNAFRAVAVHSNENYADYLRHDPVIDLHENPGIPLDRLAKTKQVVHITDLRTDPSYTGSEGKKGHRVVALVEVVGARTFMAVPMLKEGELIGSINIYRQEVRPFTDKQIELVKNFAAQAVIAIENTRLLSELRESLQQQTATADVLKVISSSPGELEPVFNAMLENATRICEAKMGVLFLSEGDAFRTVALHGAPPAYAEARRREPVIRPGPGTSSSLSASTKQPAQIADIRAEPAYTNHPERFAILDLAGARTMLNVPMLKEDELVGQIAIYRQEVRPFTDKQIDLVKNFAAQAVIAIENARLLKELRQRTTDLSKSLEDLRTAQDRLVQTEKLASLGQLTAGIAHEIKNPLNFVNNFSGVSAELIDELQDVLKGISINHKARTEINELTDTLRGNLDKVVQHGKRADAIVKNMLLHSRQGSGEHRPVDINAIVEESLNLAYHGARAEKQGFNITLESSFDPTAGKIDVFPQEITRVLLNLISNGFYAATKRKAEANGGDHEPTLVAATKNLGDSVEIRIRDNGTGIPPEVKERMFNPFFTTKPAGEGTGLGLSISHDIIVKQHGGSIEVDTQPGEFTEFRIVLPRWAATIAKSGERP
jgi:signal transduction histidine kinase